MKRRLFAILSTLSLLLCVAVVVLWVRSYWAMDSLDYRSGRFGLYLDSTRGLICVLQRGFPYAPENLPDGWNFSSWSWDSPSSRSSLDPREYGDSFWARIGFSYDGLSRNERLGDFRSMSVPYWSLAAALLPPPLAWLYKRLRHAKQCRTGLCPSCGYDLRATPERCPECGHVNSVAVAPPEPGQPTLDLPKRRPSPLAARWRCSGLAWSIVRHPIGNRGPSTSMPWARFSF